jgi:hypothetical protein
MWSFRALWRGAAEKIAGWMNLLIQVHDKVNYECAVLISTYLNKGVLECRPAEPVLLLLVI